MIPPETLVALRFGTGLPLPEGAAATPEAMRGALAGPDRGAALYPVAGLAEVLPVIAEAQSARGAVRKDRKDAALERRLKAAREALGALEAQGQRASIARAVDAPDPFRERLVRFWADHFTVQVRRAFDAPLAMAFIEDAVRPHVAGRFAAMLRAATLHPAMLISLDQVSSIGPNSRAGKRRERGLNENLARELIELHTLGVGAGYAQGDVRELAELLTGLAVSPTEGFVFRPEWVEPGDDTILGRTYGGKGVAPILTLLDDLAARPETRAHLSRKLATHFVADEPEPALVAALEAAWADSDGDLGAVSAALLAHPAAWEGRLMKARQPFDFVVAALKGLGVTGAQVTEMRPKQWRNRVMQPMAAMGQPFGRPRGPDGWAEEAGAWITPQGLAARIAWAMRFPGPLTDGKLPDPVALADRALGPAADERLLWAAARAETRVQGVGIVLSSPAFNRR